jgi:ketosteroid isomerase-like protein
MRQSILTFGVLLIGLVLLSCVQQPRLAEQTTNTEIDVAEFEAAVLGTLKTFSETVIAGDVDGWIALWDDNGVQMGPKAPALHGKAAIREEFSRTHLPVKFKEFTINNEEVQTFGDFGFARGSYFVTVLDEGEPKNSEGKYLTIFRRQHDGSWKIYCDCFNSTFPQSREPAS